MSVSPTNTGGLAHAESTEADPLLGLTLDNRFRLTSLVGKGAMGRVYRAVQLPLNRPVALKVLDGSRGVGREETFKQRFIVEASMTAKLNHPNTVRVLDYGVTTDGIMYLAMEYLDGQTLERAVAQGPIGWQRVWSIAQQTARALREAHALGVVHRDLKPANIMLLHADDETDHVKVLDFGLVKSFVEGRELEGRAITQTGMLMGSPPYMAPEQGELNRADPRSDIYSLGTVLYECLTGRPPFTGRSALEIIIKHVNQPVPAIQTPEGLGPIPPEMVAIVMRCLEKSPMDRYQSMDDVLAAIGSLTPPVLAPSQLAFTPVPSARSRLPWFVGAFVLALAAGVGATLALVRPAPPVAVPAAIPATPPVPTEVIFHIESEPSGATVAMGGTVLGETPIDVPLAPAEAGASVTAEFMVERDGYQSSRLSASGTGPRVELKQVLIRLPLPLVVPVVASEPSGADEKRPRPTPAPQPQPQPQLQQPRAIEPAKPAVKLLDLDDPLAPQAPPASADDLKRPAP